MNNLINPVAITIDLIIKMSILRQRIVIMNNPVMKNTTTQIKIIHRKQLVMKYHRKRIIMKKEKIIQYHLTANY